MEFKIVYAIVHNPTGKIYIGSTRHEKLRIRNHMNLLRSGKHKNKAMQEDFNKYGEDYSVYKLDVIPNRSFKEREYFWMAFFQTYNPEKGYNDNFPEISMDNFEQIPDTIIGCIERTAEYLNVSVDEILEMRKEGTQNNRTRLAAIEDWCANNGTTIAALERSCGFGNATIRGWEKSSPRLDNLQKVSDFTKIPISELVKE